MAQEAGRSEQTRSTTHKVINVVAVVIISVVALGLLLPMVCSPATYSRRAACMNNIRQIGLALNQYAGEYDGQYPPPVDPGDPDEPAQYRFAYLLSYGYLNSDKVFRCPSAQGKVPPDLDKLDGGRFMAPSLKSICTHVLADDMVSYGFDPDASRNDHPGRAILADRPPDAGRNVPSTQNSPNHKGDGQNVVYVDGHVKWNQNLRDDSGADPNIFADNPDSEVEPTRDADIDWGRRPASPE